MPGTDWHHVEQQQRQQRRERGAAVGREKAVQCDVERIFVVEAKSPDEIGAEKWGLFAAAAVEHPMHQPRKQVRHQHPHAQGNTEGDKGRRIERCAGHAPGCQRNESDGRNDTEGLGRLLPRRACVGRFHGCGLQTGADTCCTTDDSRWFSRPDLAMPLPCVTAFDVRQGAPPPTDSTGDDDTFPQGADLPCFGPACRCRGPQAHR